MIKSKSLRDFNRNPLTTIKPINIIDHSIQNRFCGIYLIMTCIVHLYKYIIYYYLCNLALDNGQNSYIISLVKL